MWHGGVASVDAQGDTDIKARVLRADLPTWPHLDTGGGEGPHYQSSYQVHLPNIPQYIYNLQFSLLLPKFHHASPDN